MIVNSPLIQVNILDKHLKLICCFNTKNTIIINIKHFEPKKFFCFKGFFNKHLTTFSETKLIELDRA